MSYDARRVDGTPQQHAVAKELDDLFEAIAKGQGNVIDEAIEAVMAGLAYVMSVEDKKKELIKLASMVVIDNLVEAMEGPPE